MCGSAKMRSSSAFGCGFELRRGRRGRAHRLERLAARSAARTGSALRRRRERRRLEMRKLGRLVRRGLRVVADGFRLFVWLGHDGLRQWRLPTGNQLWLPVGYRGCTDSDFQAVFGGKRFERDLRPGADVLDHLGGGERAEPRGRRASSFPRERPTRKPAANRSPAPVVSTTFSIGAAGTRFGLARRTRRRSLSRCGSRPQAARRLRSAGERGVEIARSRRANAARARWRTRCRRCRSRISLRNSSR